MSYNIDAGLAVCTAVKRKKKKKKKKTFKKKSFNMPWYRIGTLYQPILKAQLSESVSGNEKIVSEYLYM